MLRDMRNWPWTDRARAPRSDAVENLLVQVGDLVLRGDLYASVLEITMESVQQKLATVKERAAAILAHGVEDAA